MGWSGSGVDTVIVCPGSKVVLALRDVSGSVLSLRAVVVVMGRVA